MINLIRPITHVFDRLFHPVRVLSPRDAYRLWAPTYDDRKDNAIIFLEERVVMPALDSVSVPGKAVIDLGCGTGRHFAHLAARGARRIVGIDLSREMLSVASKTQKSMGACLIESDLRQLPIIDSQFDLGIASLVLSHVRDLTGSLLEIRRVLKKNAHLILVDLHWMFELRGWKRTFRAGADDARRYAVQHQTHTMNEYVYSFDKSRFFMELCFEPPIDTSLRPFFERANMMKTYARFEGKPLLVAFTLRAL